MVRGRQLDPTMRARIFELRAAGNGAKKIHKYLPDVPFNTIKTTLRRSKTLTPGAGHGLTPTSSSRGLQQPMSDDASPSASPSLDPKLSRSFNNIRTWFANVEQHATEGVNKILIGNKCDWEDKRVVSTEQGQQLADELGIPFLEVSAKSNINIDKAFYSLAADIKKRLIDNQKSEAGAGGASGGAGGVPIAQAGGSGGKCC
ncbi:hypothetical protein BN1708_013778 [Verticillium longisporum]|uniref:Uncharacterized protein n=1 Tax=Verticillium longisporum TaxID=100787 RepID=A0A0G4LP13_VERLO|nr:hypothetical protein BN1708_013778 [Verticillium longisporum]